jgi:hypothetical protein
MEDATRNHLRTAGITCIVGAAATTLGGIVVHGIVQPVTTVSDHRWSYPWSSGALVPISLLWASLHLLVFVGLLGFARSGLAGPSAARASAPLSPSSAPPCFSSASWGRS